MLGEISVSGTVVTQICPFCHKVTKLCLSGIRFSGNIIMQEPVYECLILEPYKGAKWSLSRSIPILYTR